MFASDKSFASPNWFKLHLQHWQNACCNKLPRRSETMLSPMSLALLQCGSHLCSRLHACALSHPQEAQCCSQPQHNDRNDAAPISWSLTLTNATHLTTVSRPIETLLRSVGPHTTEESTTPISGNNGRRCKQHLRRRSCQ